MARQHAIKFQQIRKHRKTELETLTFDAAVFAKMETEDVGNGVFEFEFQGSKYDAFEMTESDGKVHLLVKRDGFETIIDEAIKHVKRFTRAKSEQIKNTLFNFYFAPIRQTVNSVLKHGFLIFYTPLFNFPDTEIGLESPPPEKVK